MTSIELPLIVNNDGDEYLEIDSIDSLLNGDDILSAVVAAMNDSEQKTEDKAVPEEVSSQPIFTFTTNVPNPLASIQNEIIPTVSISPSSSCKDLKEFLDIEPTTLAEMTSSSSSSILMVDSASIVSEDQSLCASSITQGVLVASTPVSPLTTKSKKRKREINVSPSSSVGEENRQLKSRLRNREHARKSRLRRKSLTGDLQISLKALKDENQRLREYIFSKIGKNKGQSIISQKVATPNENLIQSLKSPKNRILTNDALQFISGLRSDLSL